MAGLPTVRQCFARTYFEELDKRVSGNKRLPVWEGELYFEYHRGTYTSMARNKRANRKAELHMMDLELLSVLARTGCLTRRKNWTACGKPSCSISSTIFFPAHPFMRCTR